MNAPRLLNIGCGQLIGEHWLNIDSSPNVLLDNYRLLKTLLYPLLPKSSRETKFRGAKYVDLRHGLPFAANYFDAVFSSHFLEHLYLEDGLAVLRETYRCLKPGGKVRFILPSLDAEIDQYFAIKKSGNPLASTEYARISNVFERPKVGPWWYKFLLNAYNKNSHKMFYNSMSLKHYFSSAGFSEIEDRQYLQSNIPYLNEVEMADRFSGAFCLEGVK